MKKRGLITGEILMFVVELTLIALCFVSLMGFVQTVAKGTIVERNFLTKDISLLFNILYASPNLVQQSYFHENIDLSQFDIKIDDGLVSIADKPSEDVQKPIPATYRFATDKNIGLRVADWDTRIEMINDGNSLYVEKDLTLGNFRLFCDRPVPVMEVGRVIIDPGNGGDDKGFTNEKEKESEIVLGYAKALDEELTKNAISVDATRSRPTGYEDDVGVDRFDYLARIYPKDIVISIHLGKYDNTSNYLKAYVPMNRDPIFRSFVCNLLNDLGNTVVQGSRNFESVSIFEIEPTLIRKDSEQAILFHKNSVMLEIGNIDYATRLARSDFAKIITKNLKEFKK